MRRIHTSHSRGSRRALRLSLVLSAGLAVAGCGTVINENHYFAAFHAKKNGDREATQFYRVHVQGTSGFSNVRYLTGYFDDRAVSLYFNEIKPPENQRLFDDSRTTLPGQTDKITPLSPTADNGAFMIIMSSNAQAVADTIGNFADSQTVADNLTALMGRDRIRARQDSEATTPVQKAAAVAMMTQVKAHDDAASGASSGHDASLAYLRMLTVLARGVGYGGKDFATTTESQAFFDAFAAKVGDQP
jgi:hypothetical protein